MDFLLSEEHQMLQRMVRDFATNQIEPHAREIDASHQYPADIIAQLSELGLMGMMVPEEYGGADLGALAYAIAMEEVSKACASTGVIMSVNNSLVCAPIYSHGTEEQKEAYLPDLATGGKLGCFSLSEPGSGSDAAGMTTVALRDGDDFVINGTKNWITNGREADLAVLIALSAPQLKTRGISAFIVDTKSEGLTVGKSEEKLGICGSSTTTYTYEDVRVPAENILGEENHGFKVAMKALDGGRIGIAAQALGIGRAAFEKAVKYSTERHAFGGPISNFQALQFMVADMATKLDAARMLVWRAAWMKDQHQRCTKESAMAKVFASEAANYVVDRALQMHGGFGFSKEFDAERHYRDQRITEIYEGTSEIQRLVIGRETLKQFASL